MISIIVPVYKVENYLRFCVGSVLAQSYSDFELILVDDGSPDKCGEICDSYAEKDSRIHVIHQPNKGVSAARNAGLKAASGEYVAFIDGDDVVHVDYLRLLYQAIVRTKADVSMCGYEKVTDASRPDFGNAGYHISVISGAEGAKRVLWRETCYMVCWGKLFRKEWASLLTNPEELRYDEDFYTMHRLFYRIGKAAVLSCALYGYVERGDDAVGSFSRKRIEDALFTGRDAIRYYEEAGDREMAEYAQAYYLFRLQSGWYYGYRYGKDKQLLKEWKEEHRKASEKYGKTARFCLADRIAWHMFRRSARLYCLVSGIYLKFSKRS